MTASFIHTTKNFTFLPSPPSTTKKKLSNLPKLFVSVWMCIWKQKHFSLVGVCVRLYIIIRISQCEKFRYDKFTDWSKVLHVAEISLSLFLFLCLLFNFWSLAFNGLLYSWKEIESIVINLNRTLYKHIRLNGERNRENGTDKWWKNRHKGIKKHS